VSSWREGNDNFWDSRVTRVRAAIGQAGGDGEDGGGSDNAPGYKTEM